MLTETIDHLLTDDAGPPIQLWHSPAGDDNWTLCHADPRPEIIDACLASFARALGGGHFVTVHPGQHIENAGRADLPIIITDAAGRQIDRLTEACERA